MFTWIFGRIIVDNLSFIGTSEDLRGKSIKVPKIVLKHSPQSLIKVKSTLIMQSLLPLS